MTDTPQLNQGDRILRSESTKGQDCEALPCMDYEGSEAQIEIYQLERKQPLEVNASEEQERQGEGNAGGYR